MHDPDRCSSERGPECHLRTARFQAGTLGVEPNVSSLSGGCLAPDEAWQISVIVLLWQDRFPGPLATRPHHGEYFRVAGHPRSVMRSPGCDPHAWMNPPILDRTAFIRAVPVFRQAH